jgi:hypothetical protein
VAAGSDAGTPANNQDCQEQRGEMVATREFRRVRGYMRLRFVMSHGHGPLEGVSIAANAHQVWVRDQGAGMG